MHMVKLGCLLFLTRGAFLFHSSSQIGIFLPLMANWATLRPFILQRIVSIYSASINFTDSDCIDILLSYLRLNQICRHWRTVVKESTHAFAVLLCTIPTADQQRRYDNKADSNELASRGILLSISSSHPVLWRTNIPHIVSSKSSSVTTELIIYCRGCSVDFPSLGVVLDKFGFSSAKWYSLKSLHFLDDTSTVMQKSDTKKSISDDAQIRLSNTLQYLIKHVPYVKHLVYSQTSEPSENLTSFPLGELLDFYLPRLQTLSLFDFTLPALTYKHFPQYLTLLKLTITSDSAEHLPKIFAPSLQILCLNYTDTVHYWDIFRGSFPESVVFESLESLTICHLYADYSLAENKDAYLLRISFPKLKNLSMTYHPFRDSSAFTIFKNAPLQDVAFHNRIDKFDISVLSTFRDVSELRISIVLRTNKMDDKLIELIAKDIFIKPSSTRTAEVSIWTSLPIPLPDTILWIRLEKFFMHFPVYLSDLTAIISKLPLLRWLFVGAIYCTDNYLTDYSIIPIWSNSITQLTLFSSVALIPTVPSLDAMCTLVSGLPSLLKLAVPDDMVSTADETLSEHSIDQSLGEAKFEVVGYLPNDICWYLESGIPYTTRHAN